MGLLEGLRAPTEEEYKYVKGYLLHDAKLQKKSERRMGIILLGVVFILWNFAWKLGKLAIKDIMGIEELAERLPIVCIAMILLVFGLWIFVHIIGDYINNEPTQYWKYVMRDHFQILDVMVKEIESANTYIEGDAGIGQTAKIYDIHGNLIEREVYTMKALKKAVKSNAEASARRPVIPQIKEGAALFVCINYRSKNMSDRTVILPIYSCENELCRQGEAYYQKYVKQ